MKTTKFRLLAMMITLAAVTIAATTPTFAQRRSTSTETSGNQRTLKSSNNSRSTNERKSSSQSSNTRSNSSNRTIRQSTPVQQRTKQATTPNRSTTTTRSTRVTTPNNSRTQVNTGTNNQDTRTTRNSSGTVTNRNSNQNTTNVTRNSRNTSNERSVTRSATNRNSSSGAVTTNRGSSSTTINSANRNAREKYKVDETDRRYSTSREYHGSSTTWTSRNRPDRMNYNRNTKKFYKNYNYISYNHWDRRWENYHWGFNSWVDYYNGYNPYSYQYHRYYRYHPHYGHVIRRFVNPPAVFVHNHINYYCYDGHFFRYHSGIGYVLVDMPYGMVFEYIPVGYEQVYINGYPYFRVGNLFFELDNYGFHLIHYPERYYSINVSFSNNGYVY